MQNEPIIPYPIPIHTTVIYLHIYFIDLQTYCVMGVNLFVFLLYDNLKKKDVKIYVFLYFILQISRHIIYAIYVDELN